MRWPVPVTITTSAFPLAHPGRLTISWMSAASSGVRWLAPTWPAAHAAGAQLAQADVRARVDMFPDPELKVAALSAA